MLSELADYRLTAEVFERFVLATGRVAAIARDDPSFTYAPLFTKDVALTGDVVAAASALVARVENHPAWLPRSRPRTSRRASIPSSRLRWLPHTWLRAS
jgi:hypothetical protein